MLISLSHSELSWLAPEAVSNQCFKEIQAYFNIYLSGT